MSIITATRRWRHEPATHAGKTQHCLRLSTIVHVFIVHRLWLNKLHFRSTDTVVEASATEKFDRGLSQLLHDYLHWLDVPQRVQYKLAVMVHRCLGRRAPSYLADYCVPVSTVPGRQHLRSASRRQLIVPHVHRSTLGARAFTIAGPTVWNSLPDSLRDPAVGPDHFRRDLKTHLFEWHCVSFSALAVFSRNALYKSTSYLLTIIIRHTGIVIRSFFKYDTMGRFYMQ